MKTSFLHQAYVLIVAIAVGTVHPACGENPAAPGVIVPDDGEAVSIVLPAKPTISETFAAKELKYHLEKATGKSIPVVDEASAEGEGRRLYVGNVKVLAAAGIDYGQLDVEERIVKGVGRDV